MLFFLPHTRRAYLRALLITAFAFGFVILIIHGLLTHLGLRAEATYLDDALVAIAVGLLVLSLEARYEATLKAERERAMLSLGLNHHIRNALQAIVYVSSTVEDKDQARMLAEAAQRIEWALREVPKGASTPPLPAADTAKPSTRGRTHTA